MTEMIGLIGTASRASLYLEAMVRHPRVQAVALAAADDEARQQLHRRWGIIKAVHDDYHDLLADAAIAAVAVCAPLAEREAIIVEALAAGKHVLTEVPYAVTEQGANAVLDAATPSPGKLLVTLPERYLPAHERARKLLQEESLGRPLLGAVMALNLPTDDNLLLSQAYHGVDLLQYLLGPASAVTASTTGEVALVSLELPEGVLAQLTLVAAADERPQIERRIVCAKGMMLIRDNPEDELPLIVYQGDEVFPVKVKNPPTVMEYAAVQAVEALLTSAYDDAPPPATVDEAHSSLRATLAAQQSAAEGRRTTLP